MAKDPAFLFYYQDFLVGVSFMTLEEIGAYIKLLCFQADRGPLSEQEILKKIPDNIWHAICDKFEKGPDGRFYNKRMAVEIEKRRLYTESRKNNLHKVKHMDSHMARHMTPHMENENDNVNINSIKEFMEYFNSKTEKTLKLTPERERIIKARLKDHTIVDLKTAVDNFVNDDWPERHKYCDVVYCIGVRKGVDNLDKWLQVKQKAKRNKKKYGYKSDCDLCNGTGKVVIDGPRKGMECICGGWR